MRIAVASGKGGTGKSTISTNLAYFLSDKYENIALLDCDVEEPNCHIFLRPEFDETEIVKVPVPKIDKERCVSCGKCAAICQYNAMAFVKNKVLVFDELCHGCGGCMLTCPAGAIIEGFREVGVIKFGSSGNLVFIQGESRIGEAMSPPLINAVKKYGRGKGYQTEILDCPPGTSCPMISAVSDADYVVMVTEPTPFGLYDLKLGVDVIKKIGIPFGIVINRSGENDNLIEDWAKNEGINVITKIPEDRKVAELYSKGEIYLKYYPEFEKYYEPLVDIIRGQK